MSQNLKLPVEIQIYYTRNKMYNSRKLKVVAKAIIFENKAF